MEHLDENPTIITGRVPTGVFVMITDYQLIRATGMKIEDVFDGNFGTELGGYEAYDCDDLNDTLNHEAWYAIHAFEEEVYNELHSVRHDASLTPEVRNAKIAELENEVEWFYNTF